MVFKMAAVGVLAVITFRGKQNPQYQINQCIMLVIVITASSCASTDFRCADGVRCIRPCARCDGVVDCSDSSDELNCSEYKSHFVHH